MFDNCLDNIILLTDNTDRTSLTKGLGLPLSEVLAVPFADINWHKVNKLKLLRATQYKESLFKVHGIEPVITDGLSWRKQLLKYQTFTSYLTNRIAKLGA